MEIVKISSEPRLPGEGAGVVGRSGRPLVQRGFDARRRKGRPAQPCARCVEDRVSDRGRHRRGRGFADAQRTLMTAIDQGDVEFRDVRKREDRIARPIRAGDAGSIEGHFLEQRPAQRLQDAALDLRSHRVRIDHQTAIVGARHLENADGAGGLFDLGVHAHRHIGLRLLVMDIGDPAAVQPLAAAAGRRNARAPVHQLADPLQHLPGARIGQEPKSIFERIGAGRRGELVEKALHRQDIPDLARARRFETRSGVVLSHLTSA